MSSIRRTIGIFTSLAIVFGCVASSQAQATRTWVSGVGDDANPCSRTAPCKTFAGAISKTAAGGEINVLDPGGFGAVTITKAITISSEGFEAGVLVSGTNGIVVNTPNATDVVVIRGLDIEGLGTGLSGITFLGQGTLHVERCTINHFIGGASPSTGGGIFFAPTNPSQLFVKDTIVRSNSSLNSGGIQIAPTGAGTAMASISNVRMEGNLVGLRVTDNSKVTVANSVAAGNLHNGFLCASTTANAELNLDSCVATNNGTNGVSSVNPNATVRISNVIISNNAVGLSSTGSGKILSFQNNHNADSGMPTGTITPQ